MSGLSRTPGKRVQGNTLTRVRIPPSPPNFSTTPRKGRCAFLRSEFGLTPLTDLNQASDHGSQAAHHITRGSVPIPAVRWQTYRLLLTVRGGGMRAPDIGPLSRACLQRSPTRYRTPSGP